MQYFKFLLFLILLFPLASCVDRLMFFPPKSSYSDVPEVLKIPVNQRDQISAIYLKSESEHYTLLFSHGNAEDIGHNIEYFRKCQREGFSVFAYDYRGYGTSDGKPSEQKTYQDITAAYTYLIDTLEVPAHRIIVYGRSIGSGPSCYLASRKPVGGLILESAFTSGHRIALGLSLLFDPYDNLSRIHKVQCPVFVIHGKRDSVVPIGHGQAIYQVANEPKINYWVENAGHNDLLYVAGKTYWEKLKEFEKLINDKKTERRP